MWGRAQVGRKLAGWACVQTVAAVQKVELFGDVAASTVTGEQQGEVSSTEARIHCGREEGKVLRMI